MCLIIMYCTAESDRYFLSLPGVGACMGGTYHERVLHRGTSTATPRERAETLIFQGDEERTRGLTIEPLNDRRSVKIPGAQVRA